MKAKILSVCLAVLAPCLLNAAPTTLWETRLFDDVKVFPIFSAPSCQLITTEGNFVYSGIAGSSEQFVVSLSATAVFRWEIPRTEVLSSNLVRRCAADSSGGFLLATITSEISGVLERRRGDGSLHWRRVTAFAPMWFDQDADGNIYLTDQRARFAKISAGGDYLYDTITPPGLFLATVDRQARKMALIESNDRLVVINDSGALEQVVQLNAFFPSPVSLFRFAANDGQYFVAADGGNLVSFSSAGTELFRLPSASWNRIVVSDVGKLTTMSLVNSNNNYAWRQFDLAGAPVASVTVPSFNTDFSMDRDGEVRQISLNPNTSTFRRISSAGLYSDLVSNVKFGTYFASRPGFGWFAQNLSASGLFQAFSDGFVSRGISSPIGTRANVRARGETVSETGRTAIGTRFSLFHVDENGTIS